MTMLKCGLLGRKLGHSYSPQIHARFEGYTYELFEKEPEELENFLLHGDFDGLNVTMPYKKDVMQYCRYVDPLAARIGAVNTIVRKSDGLYAYNTDYSGLATLLRRAHVGVSDRRVLVCGTGGASHTVETLLKDQHAAEVVVLGRENTENYTKLSPYYGYELLINATPVGMYPNNGERLFDLSPFTELESVIDVIYNPWRTDFVLQAEARGLHCGGGLPMLVAQAASSAAYFTGREISAEAQEQILKELLCETVNLALVGMPGSGKSEIGRRLAEISGREFVDVDAEIVKEAGMEIPEIFEKEGEKGFREREHAQLARVAKDKSRIIATGGGAVLREDNRRLLRCNSLVVFLGRALCELAVEGRPLSGDMETLKKMYAGRVELYRQCADLRFNNDSDPDTIAQGIWREYNAHLSH